MERISPISFLPQLDIFDYRTFHHDCHVIGDGAAGSWIVDALVSLGVPRVHVYDDDTVQARNVPAQAFFPRHVRDDEPMRKVDATKERHAEFPQTEIIPHPERVGEHHRFSGVVFLCVDSMDARRLIWEHCLRRHVSVPFLVEVRMGAEQMRIYSLEPANELHVEHWEKVSQYASGHAEAQACTNRAIRTTVFVLAGLAVHQMTLWHRGMEYKNSLIIGLQGPLLEADRWV